MYLDLNINHNIIELLEENIKINLHDLRFGNSFLDMTLKPQATN